MLKFYCVLISVILFLCLEMPFVRGHNQTRTAGLLRTLFHPARYTRSVRPVFDTATTSHVKVELSIMQVLRLNMREEYLSFKATYRLSWRDEYLRWNATEWGGIERLYPDFRKIWIPDIATYNLLNVNPGKAIINLANDGQVYMSQPMTLMTSCQINVRRFPVDLQQCHIMLSSWGYTSEEIDLCRNIKPVLKTEENVYTANGELNIAKLKIECVPKIWHINGKTLSYDVITFTVRFERLPLYYVSNFLLPCVLIELLAMSVFLLNADSGQKVSLSVTLVLGVTVLLLVLHESMPINSRALPLLGVYYLKVLIFITFNAIVTILVTCIYQQGETGNPVPTILKRICCTKYLGRKPRPAMQSLSSEGQENSLEMSNRKRNSDTPAESMSASLLKEEVDSAVKNRQMGAGGLLLNTMSAFSRYMEENRVQKDRKECMEEWHSLAVAADKVFFAGFLMLNVVSTTIILVIFMA